MERDEASFTPDPISARAVHSHEPALQRLERQIGWSQLALVWERLWPALLWPSMVVGLFLSLAWFGLWGLLSPGARFAGLVAMATLFLGSLAPLARLSLPSRSEAIDRLDRSGGVDHRPVVTLHDHLPATTQDPVARGLWLAHLRREIDRAAQLSVERPRPDLSRVDPFALRAAMVLVLVVGTVFAGGTAWQRVGQVFRNGTDIVLPPPRIDAWITPPAYTGRPTVFLSFDRAQEEGALRVPTGSALTVRSDRGRGIEVKFNGKALEGDNEVALDSQARAFRSTLVTPGMIDLQRDGLTLRNWRVAIDPDNPPVIAFDGPILKTPQGALRVRYRLEDDYGVASAFAEIKPVIAEKPTRSLGLSPPVAPRPLVEAPEFPLQLVQSRGRTSNPATTRDISEHPWAGGLAQFTLVARDDLGQEGRSQTVLIELPQRRFTKPLARILVEQRRIFSLNAEARDSVALVLDTIVLDPERRIEQTKTYLALRSLYHRLYQARDDDELRAVVEAMWEVALLIEDGDLSPAERALRQAQERLEQALERGATPEELREIMRELRQAMQDLMRELAERALQDRREGRQQPPQTGEERVISQQDLERLMREIENLTRQGRHEEARELMAQLRDLLNALRNARPQLGEDQAGGQEQLLEELGDIVREQQRLLDQTFRERQRSRRQQGEQRPGGQRGEQGQRQPGQGRQPGEGGEPGNEEGLRGLQESQQALRDRLQRFLDQLREGGHEPGKPFGDADGQMGQAEGELGQGRPGEALGPQNKALDNLRRGANQLAREMLGQGEGGPNGDPGGPQARAEGRNSNGDDPLRRNPSPDDLTNDSGIRIPGPDRQRIQEILQDVRKRLADPNRSPLERDYLERLLRPF